MQFSTLLAATLLVGQAIAAEPAKTIDVYVTPYYSASI